MARALLVYGWTDTRNGKQVRAIMAAHSAAEVMRTAKLTRTEWQHSGGPTGNDVEVQMATTKPHTILWQPLNQWPNDEWFYDTDKAEQ